MDNIVAEMAKNQEIDPKLLKDLINLEQKKVHLQKRRNIGKEILEIIDSYIEEQ